MTIDWETEAATLGILELGGLLMTHFGYVAIAASAALLKLAIAATLAAYTAFLCATLVGGLAMYFPTRFIMWVTEHFELINDYTRTMLIAMQCGLSPMVGAFILNFALGWSLALTPMLAVGGVATIAGLATMYVLRHCCSSQNKNECLEFSDGVYSMEESDKQTESDEGEETSWVRTDTKQNSPRNPAVRHEKYGNSAPVDEYVFYSKRTERVHTNTGQSSTSNPAVRREKYGNSAPADGNVFDSKRTEDGGFSYGSSFYALEGGNDPRSVGRTKTARVHGNPGQRSTMYLPLQEGQQNTSSDLYSCTFTMGPGGSTKG